MEHFFIQHVPDSNDKITKFESGTAFL